MNVHVHVCAHPSQGTFRPERLEPICNRFNLDYEAAMENIFYIRALNSEHQMLMLPDLCTLLQEQQGIVKLVIIDSVMALFRYSSPLFGL